VLGPAALVALALAVTPAPRAEAPAPRPALPTSVWLALAGVAGGLALWRARRRGGRRRGPHLEVVAQTALGGKARAVWLRAEGRELLLAVSPSHVAVLDRWATPEGERAAAHDARDAEAAPVAEVRERAPCGAALVPVRTHPAPRTASTAPRRWRRLR
jgi:hypothetical protein